MVEYEVGCDKKKRKEKQRSCPPYHYIASRDDVMQIRESTSRGGGQSAGVETRFPVGFSDSQREIMISILVRGYRD